MIAYAYAADLIGYNCIHSSFLWLKKLRKRNWLKRKVKPCDGWEQIKRKVDPEVVDISNSWNHQKYRTDTINLQKNVPRRNQTSWWKKEIFSTYLILVTSLAKCREFERRVSRLSRYSVQFSGCGTCADIFTLIFLTTLLITALRIYGLKNINSHWT